MFFSTLHLDLKFTLRGHPPKQSGRTLHRVHSDGILNSGLCFKEFLDIFSFLGSISPYYLPLYILYTLNSH